VHVRRSTLHDDDDDGVEWLIAKKDEHNSFSSRFSICLCVSALWERSFFSNLLLNEQEVAGSEVSKKCLSLSQLLSSVRR